MFVSDDVVFVELHKTGCTHIRNTLNDLLNGTFVGKHNQVPVSLLNSDKLFLGSVRDPWEWYVSLWAYGCDNKGVIFNNVTRERFHMKGLGWRIDPYGAFLRFIASTNADEWLSTYSDVNDSAAFRKWLSMMNSPEYLKNIGDGYSECSINSFCGLLTYRYLKLFCCVQGSEDDLNNISDYSTLKLYESKSCFIEYFVKNETLETDLLYGLSKNGVSVPNSFRESIFTKEKTNTSSRKNDSSYYYDDPSISLVLNRDRLIIEKFGYLPPSCSSI